MSEQHRGFYYQEQFQDDNQQEMGSSSFPFSSINSYPSMYNHTRGFLVADISSSAREHLQGFDGSYGSFIENLYGSSYDYKNNNTFEGAFGLSASPPEAFSSPKDEQQKQAVADAGDLLGNTETPITSNSSVSLSSTEGGVDEDSNKSNKEEQQTKGGTEDEGSECNNKGNKPKKKAEKKERAPRFMFMTKSEVDHLEDGYRWRKYGQKAVKNSPYPRSYYRCTTQKCTVKKRFERSFQDPSIVITTYEGKHSHHLPATLRGSVAAGMYSPSMLSQTLPMGGGQAMNINVPQGFLAHHKMPSSVLYDQSSVFQQPLPHLYHHHQQQQQRQFQFPDYGLLQDMVPSMFFKQE